MTKKHKKVLIWIDIIITAVVCIKILQIPKHETDIEKYLQGHGKFDTMAQSVFPTSKEVMNGE